MCQAVCSISKGKEGGDGNAGWLVSTVHLSTSLNSIPKTDYASQAYNFKIPSGKKACDPVMK